jgi:hypothetical protein
MQHQENQTNSRWLVLERIGFAKDVIYATVC